MNRASPFSIAGTTVAVGTRGQIDIPVSRLASGSWLSLPVEVVNGAHPGRVLWLTGAIHGDELNGVEIIRAILTRLDPQRLSGVVVAVPMVNVFGVLQGDRYLPDRRDLNRSFPGSRRGSLASRLARLLMRDVVTQGQLGIDFHTGTNGRINLPHIRVDKGHREAIRFANAFGAPVVYHAKDRQGSLRWAASRFGIPSLLYEGGEAFRFDDAVIELGVAGALRVMMAAGMLRKAPAIRFPTLHCHMSRWVRAKAGGICRVHVGLGARVTRNQPLATVGDAFNTMKNLAHSPIDGIVLSVTRQPFVNSGDALVHVGKVSR